MLIGLNFFFIGITAYYQPYLTDNEFLKIKDVGHKEANIQRNGKCSKQGCGVNNCLDLFTYMCVSIDSTFSSSII
jgi:hypothetical protein